MGLSISDTISLPTPLGLSSPSGCWERDCVANAETHLLCHSRQWSCLFKATSDSTEDCLAAFRTLGGSSRDSDVDFEEGPFNQATSQNPMNSGVCTVQLGPRATLSWWLIGC